jgi:hypothetical protein
MVPKYQNPYFGSREKFGANFCPFFPPGDATCRANLSTSKFNRILAEKV